MAEDTEIDSLLDRIDSLLLQATDAVRDHRDMATVMLYVQEIHDTAQRLPKRLRADLPPRPQGDDA